MATKTPRIGTLCSLQRTRLQGVAVQAVLRTAQIKYATSLRAEGARALQIRRQGILGKGRCSQAREVAQTERCKKACRTEKGSCAGEEEFEKSRQGKTRARLRGQEVGGAKASRYPEKDRHQEKSRCEKSRREEEGRQEDSREEGSRSEEEGGGQEGRRPEECSSKEVCREKRRWQEKSSKVQDGRAQASVERGFGGGYFCRRTGFFHPVSVRSLSLQEVQFGEDEGFGWH
ncbi:MAG: hypothetical protein P8K76_03940 [Candidatus Binatia bacterium]|nr:hypothetical protein [Candidatus Binatia bacterium]MDG1958781.1 hypothetical protein [Candidatus Binatia bacterium]MDG2008911.1 hypothetical protein [Candidatus Binatia bacterium]